MVQTEHYTLGYTYQSDKGETEDEEVKRNCVMGESGMRDSDFSDSDSDDEGYNESHRNNGKNRISDELLMENRMGDLVKFVSVGSPIVKTKGLVLHRPTAIIPSFASNVEKPDENDDLPRNDSKIKFGISPRLRADKDKGISASDSNSCCSSKYEDENKSVDDESIESDTDMKSTPLNFPFNGGDELSMEIGTGIINTIGHIEHEYCESSFDEQEAQEMTGGYALVGASGASVDDKWLTAKQKRLLSSNSLFALNEVADRNTGLPKKMRMSQDSSKYFCAIPESILGIEALDQIIQPLPRHYSVRDDPLLILSDGDEEDMMLSEELEGNSRDNSVGFGCSSNLPIPLLTPPESPRTMDETFVEKSTISVEWPSNLVLDTAIMKAFANVSPVSTNTERDLKTKNDSTQTLVFGESPERSSASRLRTISIETH